MYFLFILFKHVVSVGNCKAVIQATRGKPEGFPKGAVGRLVGRYAVAVHRLSIDIVSRGTVHMLLHLALYDNHRVEQ